MRLVSALKFEQEPARVVCRKGAKQIPGRTSNSRESCTVIVAGNAAGQAMPPLIIMKGKTERSLMGVNVGEGPTGAKYTYQANAWTEDVLGIEWFQQIFLTQCGPARPQLLILHGHSSHESLGLLEMAKKEQTATMCLPAHTTAYLNPLDRTVFGPLKTRYSQIVSTFLSASKLNLVTKWSWPALFKQAYCEGITASNLISGFESCGIVPWNPLRVPEAAFGPNKLFDDGLTPSLTKPGEHPLTWVLRKSTVKIPATFTTPGEELATQDEHNIAEEASTVVDVHISHASLPEEIIDLGLTLEALPPSEPAASTSGLKPNWFDRVSQEFQVINTPSTTQSKARCSAHRLLTSDEILNKKRKEKEDKGMREQQKEERKRRREETRKSKGASKPKGKGKALVRVSTCKYCQKSDEEEEEGVKWVACDTCDAWIHQGCVQPQHQSFLAVAIARHGKFECLECWEDDE